MLEHKHWCGYVNDGPQRSAAVQQSVDRLALELLLQHEELSKWIADEPYDSAWLHLSEVSPKVPESFEAQSGEVNLLQLTDDAWIAALDDEELIALAHGCAVSSSASAMADDATHIADDATESHEPVATAMVDDVSEMHVQTDVESGGETDVETEVDAASDSGSSEQAHEAAAADADGIPLWGMVHTCQKL
jgi:hypothetical protein